MLNTSKLIIPETNYHIEYMQPSFIPFCFGLGF